MPSATPEERAARGRALRADVPRSAHAELPPRPAGVDPVAILAEEARSRAPDLVPVRHGRMLASPLAFLRGAPAIMAADLAATPATGLRVQLCGDAHVANFGLVAAPGGRLALDVDELDDTLPGPWEWDVKRLAASLVVAARGAGWDAAAGRDLAAAAAGAYRGALRDLAASGELEAWDARLPVDGLQDRLERDLERKGAGWRRREADPARAREGVEVLRALCDVVDGLPRLRPSAPFVAPLDGLDVLEASLAGYAAALPPDHRELLGRFRLVQVARTAAGVARVGTPSFVALLVGRDGGDPLFLGVREAHASVLGALGGRRPGRRPGRTGRRGPAPRAGRRRPAPRARADARRPAAPRATSVVGRLRDWRGAFVPEALRPATLRRYAGACGWTLARAHARVRRPRRAGRLPRQGRRLRPGRGRLRRGLRGPGRGRLGGAGRGRARRPAARDLLDLAGRRPARRPRRRPAARCPRGAGGRAGRRGSSSGPAAPRRRGRSRAPSRPPPAP